VSPTPANITRCFNGATETCTLNVATTACTFDAVEVGANPQTHLYTKLAGTAFNVDVLALSTPTTINSNYVGAVTVDLVDTSTVACPNGAALNTPQTFSFVAADHGRKTLAMTCANAAPNTQVRIKVGSTTTYACSTDKLAVRPSAVTLTSSNTLASPPSPTDANTIKAGAAFNMGAATAPNGYTGTLTLDTSKLTAQLPSDVSAQLAGGTVGTLTLSPALRANTAQGGNATYTEVGYLYVNPGAFRDTGYTNVDQLGQLAGCAATDTCDCLLSTHITNGSVPDNLSDVLINGRYGCYVGNKTGFAFGRFIPDHFVTSINAVSGVPMPCPTDPVLTCPVTYNGFVYSGQTFATQVTANNLAGGTPLNYYSNFAKAVTLSAWDAKGGTNPNPGPGAVNIATPLAAGDFVAGVGGRKDGLGNPIPYVAYTFNDTPTLPTDIYMRAVDADNVSSLISGAPATSIEGGVKVLSGRVRVSSAYGSEQLPLPISATVQYYNAAGAWLTSSTDNVTSFNPLMNLVPTIVKGPLAVGNIVMPNATVTVVNGVKSVRINRPGVTGSADIRLSGVPNYLWTGSNGAGTDPGVPGRVTFGVYKGAQEFIYMREAY
jgi:MSHA biogenesis protein MshQ